MTRNWDLLGDRPCPPDIGSGHQIAHSPVLAALPCGTDAELLAAFAAAVSRYTGRSDIVVGWSDGGPWRPVAVRVDRDRPFADLVVSAARALTTATGGRLPSVGVTRTLPVGAEAPDLLAVAADGMVRYASGMYRAADAVRFAGHLAALSSARDDGRPVGLLPLMTRAELEQMHAGNAVGPLVVDTETLPELIEPWAGSRPQAVAVRAGRRELTYEQLWARSGALAERLRPGTLVGVWAERGVDLAVGLLAVLRAGAAYVALEPSYPTARLRTVADLADLSAVLGNDGIPDLGVEVIGIGDEEGDGPATGPSPTDLAYLMFTSGSTGVPKGVMIEHRNVVNLLRHMAADPGLGPGEVALSVTTPAFDLSVPDLFLPLVTGATLVLADPDQARDGSRLAELIARARPDFMQATPSTWRMLCEAGWPGTPGMRVVCGGEGYDSALVRALHGRVAGLWNFYGPTETTVWSVSTRLDASVVDPIPIGRPMRGTACYVLDERGEPAPPGVRGELHIAGEGVARGYLGRQDLTDTAFVPCRFPGAPSDRMYRTGDLARIAADGTLRFAGRRDSQVKLHGFRIELGEIESVVSGLAGVAQAVAIVRTDGDVARLVCYVTGDGVDGHALREAAALLLPPQSVPAIIVVVPALPLNANGKVDRDALPEPPAQIGPAPVGAFEELVAGVCADVLGLPAVYADDDFFALGAYSLDIGRIAIRLTSELALDVAPGLIFRHTTVRTLALALLELVVGVESDMLAEVEAR